MIDCQLYYIAEVYSMENLLPKRGPNTYDAGTIDSQKSEVKYAYPNSTQPILQIIRPIYDKTFYPLLPGFYELNLNDDNTFMLLCQRGQVIAKIPVFKIEQDEEQMKKYAKEHKKTNSKLDALNLRKKKRARDKQKKINNKFIEENPEIYTDATMEYDEQGDYYIIKYERGMIRAWGVLKTY